MRDYSKIVERIEAKEKLLSQIPVCWYCGEEIFEARKYAVCSDECNALLMRSHNEAWCDSQSMEDIINLSEGLGGK